jgi:hypothetical protein
MLLNTNTILLFIIAPILAWTALVLTLRVMGSNTVEEEKQTQIRNIAVHLSKIEVHLDRLAHATEHPPQREPPRPPGAYTVS